MSLCKKQTDELSVATLRTVYIIQCPNCKDDEHLTGITKSVSDNELIEINCENCGLTWERDPSPSCKNCGSKDLRTALQSIVDKSRGSQLSIQSMQVVHLCPICDSDTLRSWNRSNTPLPPSELPFSNSY